MPSQVIQRLSPFGVSVDAESIVRFLAGHMDSFYCRSDALPMFAIFGKDIYINDVLISAISKMIIPLAVGGRAIPILAKGTPARRGVGIVHREPQLVPLR